MVLIDREGCTANLLHLNRIITMYTYNNSAVVSNKSLLIEVSAEGPRLTDCKVEL